MAGLGVAANLRAGVTVRSNPNMPLNENAMTIIYHKKDGMNLTGILNIKIWASAARITIPGFNPSTTVLPAGLRGKAISRLQCRFADSRVEMAASGGLTIWRCRKSDGPIIPVLKTEVHK